MGRSKFPGKPSKHVNRTRINVLPTPTGTTTVGDCNNVVTVETGNDLKKSGDASKDSENVLSSNNNIRERLVRKKQKISTKCNSAKRKNLLKAASSRKKLQCVNAKHNSKASARRSVRSFSTIQKMGTKTKHSTLKEGSNIVGKFVLPSRSIHSSRVIKPNKRFINVDSETRTFKNRVISKRQIIKVEDNKSAQNEEKPDNNSKQTPKTEENRTTCTNTKLVLRQARLKLHNQNQTGPEGPFSSGSSNISNPPGTVTCGVCGAVRFYRFVKQARKFNIYSCESCRKFISKMIKRQSNKNINTTLVCHKGQGMCHVPPIVRSQQWKLIRCAYRARCPACWLKMCLRSFQMPASLKHSLMQLLPKNMQLSDTLFTSSLPLLSWQSTVESKVEQKEENAETNCETESNRIRPRSIRLKTIKSECKVPITPPAQEIKRQKLDLKGPRVKHVCRSASIVLGQPLATFPDNKKNEQDSVKVCANVLDKLETKVQECCEGLEDKENKIQSLQEAKPTNPTILKPLLPKIENCTTIISKREKLNKNLSSHFNSTEAKLNKKSNEGVTTISIDFWEAYDPEEVYCSGFSLIGSEPFPMQAICFLCGSAGKEALLHCSLCCEPYHPYCLEQFPKTINNTSRLTWLCPRCTTCHACGQVDKQKIDCQKCHKSYHPECFNMKWNFDDKPTVCSNCLKCKSCNTDNITKFVGNLALCVNCFKLRNKGNFCPLCQKCYDDNDVNTKMMECSQCNKWIHAKCEGLLDDHYEVLSLLPETIKFMCHLCSTQSTPHWKKAVQTELRSNFNNVLRLFSKNHIVRNILKWSPLKSPRANNFMLSARKIQFTDNDESVSTELPAVSREIESAPETPRNELQEIIATSITNNEESLLKESYTPSKTPVSPIMLHIKKKVNSNEYISLKEFNAGMEEALNDVSLELLEIYRSILKKVFPWYDPSKQEDSEEITHTEPPALEEISYNVYKSPAYEYRRNISLSNDTRMCSLCKTIGDSVPHEEGRLLYCGQNEWIHANCALWSSEVYEEIDGSLQNVQSAVSRGRSIRCAYCKHKGASVGCCFKGCYETYHFKCAQQANCQFLHDKTVYCSVHDNVDKNSVITNLHDFDIRRPVYIELDKKKKKFSEPNKINFMLGSLCVTNLGKIVPVLSDTFDAIIPTGFTCSRLFWSTEEPWKLIPYIIKTSVHNAHTGNILVDKNFTINHSLPKAAVEKALKELINWQKELEKERAVDHYEFDEEEEPQNTADILSPELTDAIFDELQHDLLDGISVQDMLNSYEELLNMDFKASEMNCNENVNLNVNNAVEQKKDNEYECETEKNRGLKRSKSEILSQLSGVEKVSKVKNHQRSCSLTWSCKLDNSLAPVTKKRKIVPRDNNMFFQLLQVDGACDSSGSECGSPTHESESMHISINEEPVTCEKCQCTYRTMISYKRHLETCEAMFTSESDSDEQAATLNKSKMANVKISDNASLLVTVPETEPRVITAYESYSTYQATQNEVHSTVLNTQTFLTTESTSAEVVAVPEPTNIFYPTFQQVVEPKTMTACQPSITINQPTPITLNQPTMNMNQTDATNHQETTSITMNSATPASYCVNQQPLGVNQAAFSLNQSNIISVENNPAQTIALHQPITINPGSISVNSPINSTVDIQPQQVTIQSVPFPHEITPILNIAPQNQITIDTKMIATAPNIVNSVVAQTVVPQNQWVKPILKPIITQKTIRARTKPRLAAKRSTIPSNDNTVIVSQAGTSNSSMILQHIPSTNIVPRFLETFQQQSGQNVQYVATLTPQINSSIQPQTQLVQLQSDNSFLSIVPGVQPATMIIQPRVVQDQFLVDSSGSVVWTTQPVQPVYYGFETIVQNTVLQSSQFLPTTMPGVLTTNSSYSATTQVFQTSKLEPVLDVTQGSFVLLNSGQIINQQLPQSITQNIQNHISTTVPIQNTKQNTWKFVESNTLPENIQNGQNAAIAPIIQPVTKPAVTPLISNSNSITLPIAPFVQEQGIPTNIVTPTPKPPTSVQSRPMSRVLPMQTNHRDNKKIVEIKSSLPHPEKHNLIVNDRKNEINTKTEKVTITENFLLTKDASELILNEKIENVLLKNEQSLKLVLQKQNQDGLYKISNNYATKNSTVPIAPLKPIKPKLENLKEIAEVKIEAITVPSSNTSDEEKERIKVQKDVITSTTAEIKPFTKTENQQNNTTLLYTVETQDGFRFSSTSLNELWNKIFETVQSARLAHNMAPLPANALNTINNLQLLGLKSNGLKYLIEQLPGANKCMKYKPSYHIPTVYDDPEDDLSINHSYGCVKFMPYIKKKEPNDMFGWLASKHRKLENSLIDSELLPRRGSVTNLPMAMRFRQLKEISKTSVGVYRSSIHRRGLFALKDIEAGEMVIEYAGEVIRSVLTDKREKYYNSKGIGCYMFRVDDNLVVDATMKGNAARFINHSCDPNCFSKVVEIHGHKHIIIFALRKILCGEELTYDYKFPFEEDKIPCTCGAKKCRKFLN